MLDIWQMCKAYIGMWCVCVNEDSEKSEILVIKT